MSDDPPPRGALRSARSLGRPIRFPTWALRSWGTGLAFGAGLLLALPPQAQATDGTPARRGGFVFWRKPAVEPPATAAARAEPTEDTTAPAGPTAEPPPDDAPTADQSTAEVVVPTDLTGLRKQNAGLRAQVTTLEAALVQAREELETLQAKLEAVLAVPQAEDTELTRLYRVQEGDTLYTIAEQADIYDDGRLWRRIYEANRHALDDPKQLRPGQELIIPR